MDHIARSVSPPSPCRPLQKALLTIYSAGLFLFFSAGMAGSSISFAFQNVTTIENLNKRAAVWFFAFRLPSAPSSGVQPPLASPPDTTSSPISAATAPPPPLPVSQSTQSGSTSPPPVLTTPNPPTDPPAGPPPITVLRTAPGENPWDLGAFENWKSVMGERVIDWFLPFKASPCCNHAGGEAAYGLGRVVQRLRREAGLG